MHYEVLPRPSDFKACPRGSIYTTIRELGPKTPYYIRNYGSPFPNSCICGPSGCVEFLCLQDVTWLCTVRSYASFGTERFQISLDREEKRSIASAKHRGAFGHGGHDRCGVCGVLTFTLSQQRIRTRVARPVDCFMVRARTRECVFNAKVNACPLQKTIWYAAVSV